MTKENFYFERGHILSLSRDRAELLSKALVAIVFVAAALVRFRNAPGDDLSASYIGCKLLATGQRFSLYSHDAHDFSVVDNPHWIQAAADGGFAGTLHPYVQTPLWAWFLQPLCVRVGFPVFNRIFLAVGLALIAVSVWLVASRWTRTLNNPMTFGLILSLLFVTDPFRYACQLVQTHAIIIFLMLLALILRATRSVWAGVFLAIAAAIKITPAVLVLYLLVNRNYRACISFILSSAILFGTTILAVGWDLTNEYLHELGRISHVLLTSWNNQSFVSWRTDPFGHNGTSLSYQMANLDPALASWSTFCLVSAVALGGLSDDRGRGQARIPPVGAGLAITATTLFAPIAWTHYFIILVFPSMILAEHAIQDRRKWPFVIVACVFLMNTQRVLQGFRLREVFLSGMLTLIALSFVALREIRSRMLRRTGFNSAAPRNAAARTGDPACRRTTS